MNPMQGTSPFLQGQELVFAGTPLHSTPISMSLPPSKETVMNHFREYVEQTISYSSVEYDEALIFVRQGEHFLNSLRRGQLQNATQEERRNYIIPWTWFLIYKACAKGESFLQGMIVFEDPKHEVANFFSPAASPRLSSHYPDRVEGENYGIDQPSKLPYGFHTVLFGKLKVPDGEGEWTFMKPENYGLESTGEFLLHTIDYCKFRCLKTCAFSFVKFGRDEHLKEQFVEDGLRMQSAGFHINPQTVKEWGIAGMFPAISPYIKSPESIPSLRPNQKEALYLFLRSVKSHDWIQIRSGKEVVLSEKADPYKENLLSLFSLLKKDPEVDSPL